MNLPDWNEIFQFVIFLAILIMFVNKIEESYGFKGNLIVFTITALSSYFFSYINAYVILLLAFTFFGVIGVNRPE